METTINALELERATDLMHVCEEREVEKRRGCIRRTLLVLYEVAAVLGERRGNGSAAEWRALLHSNRERGIE